MVLGLTDGPTGLMEGQNRTNGVMWFWYSSHGVQLDMVYSFWWRWVAVVRQLTLCLFKIKMKCFLALFSYKYISLSSLRNSWGVVIFPSWIYNGQAYFLHLKLTKFCHWGFPVPSWWMWVLLVCSLDGRPSIVLKDFGLLSCVGFLLWTFLNSMALGKGVLLKFEGIIWKFWRWLCGPGFVIFIIFILRVSFNKIQIIQKNHNWQSPLKALSHTTK